jgi:hypothetical protein
MQQLKEQNKLPDGQHIKPMNLIVITDGGEFVMDPRGC